MNDSEPSNEPPDWREPYRTSDTSEPLNSRLPRSRNPWKRFFIWIAPAFVTGLVAWIMAVAGGDPVLFWFIVILITVWFGYLDAQERELSLRKPDGIGFIGWVFLYAICQVLVIPLTWILLFAGYCALTFV